MRSVVFLAFCLCAATPALAQCIAPVPPAPVDGAAASEEQLRTAMAQAREFIAQSDVYQGCVSTEMESTDLTNTSAKAVEASIKSRIAANQAMKEKVGTAANSAMQAYKMAHPH
ncbi:MAG: hypothetical protein JWN16_2449 [Alphaproteobacteria bacterium]|nr:hypothetical protein [Alphaproteobacteria bacterium]